LQMISDITAVPEVGKTYLGKVVRLAEFGAFVELFPGTDGLLHISEIAEHRVKEVKDELKEGDQILVRVMSIEGNRIKLSRKALLKEQRAKLGLPEEGGSDATPPRSSPEGGGFSRGDSGRGDSGRGDSGRGSGAPRQQAPAERQPDSNASTITIEGGDDFDEVDSIDAGADGDDEPNFNRADGVPVTVGEPRSSGGPGDSGPNAGGPGGDPRRRRRRSGGGGGRGRGPGGGSGGPGGGSRGPGGGSRGPR
jgi:polyribonucleotide nucleotidyltransferase